MKIDGRDIPTNLLRTQYGQFVEVYEVTPGRWIDLSSSIEWTPCGSNVWKAGFGMSATMELS